MEKLIITAYEDEAFKKEIGSLTVQISPKEYGGKKSINYDTGKQQGQNVQSPLFSGYKNEELTVEIPLDCTGVIEGTQETEEVKQKIKAIEDLVYKYNSSKHQSNFIELAWGTLLFKGRLKEMQSSYTLFAADGKPLRAKVKLVFIQFVNREEANRLANRQSPDVSRKVVLCAGDTIAALCQEIYGDSSLADEVARINELTGFRRVDPGTVLLFPYLLKHG